jgi:hypothetical protein
MKFLLHTALCAATLLCATGCRQEGGVSRVIVRDGDLVVSDITDQDKLKRMKELLRDAGPVPDTEKIPQFTYKAQVTDSVGSNTWLYHPDGYVRLLTMKKTPTYRLEDPRELNRLAGILR